MYIQFFPIYGFMVGVNYWDTDMSEEHPEDEEKERLFQIMFGLIGISFHWW
jgi:hypothetical protein